MTSKLPELTDTFLVDQLTSVVTTIPIWISPDPVIFDQELLIDILDD
jgi:hypothetical protein